MFRKSQPKTEHNMKALEIVTNDSLFETERNEAHEHC